MSTQNVTIAIVEDHAAFAQTLATAVQATSNFALCGVVQDLDEASTLIEHTCPDLLLIDLGLPGGSGLNLIHQARRRWRDACVSAVLTITGNDTHLLKAICAGARGYLFKSDDDVAWREALHTLSKGGGLMQSGLARHILNTRSGISDQTTREIIELVAAGYRYREIGQRLGLDEPQVATKVTNFYTRLQDNGANLSDRETELLNLLNLGYSFKQSAQHMHIQESTVKTLATRAYQKLNAGNLQEALYAARREHLLR